MNVELLRRVQAHILEKPQRLVMETWSRSDSSCGTVGCIAGWAVMLSDPEADMRVMNSVKGAEALDLPPDIAIRLFYQENWPRRFREDFYRVQHSWDHMKRHRAEVTARRIDHFIEQGE